MQTVHATIDDAQVRLSILLVDDEEDIRELLGMLLRDFGYEVHSVESGEAACNYLQEALPDILLTDIKMPGMNGIELLRTVKDRYPDMEVIMISGHGDMRLAIESLKHDAADFITKPIDDEILSIALRKVAEKILLRRQVTQYTENLERMVEEQASQLIELERKVAVEQVVEGLSATMAAITGDVDEDGVFNELPCFISIHSSHMKILSANTTFTKRFGNIAGQSSNHIYREFSGQGSCPVYQSIATKAPASGTASLATEDGTMVPVVVHTAPITTSRKKISLILEVAVDVSEVNRLRSELVLTQKKYEHIFNQVPCYITIQDRALQIVEANQPFREDFGDRVRQTYKSCDDTDKQSPVQKTFNDGAIHQTEAVTTSPNGKNYNLLVRTAPIFDEAGEVDRVLEVSTNITMVRQLQDQLTSLGMMLGSMSHGVKGLLAALDGGIYRVDSGMQKKDLGRVEKGWKVVKHRIGHMRKMVLDTLYYAKSRELDCRSLTLGEFATDLADAVEPKAREFGVAFARDFNDHDHTFQADPDALAPALINFLENAVDACLYDRGKSEYKVIFRVHQENGKVHFKITDNGTGMDRETRENMFTLFFSSKGANGTGIGLFIANQVIDRHKGAIKVESSVGKGTHFHIRLPLSQGAGGENKSHLFSG